MFFNCSFKTFQNFVLCKKPHNCFIPKTLQNFLIKNHIQKFKKLIQQEPAKEGHGNEIFITRK